jgi:hypothetical protein
MLTFPFLFLSPFFFSSLLLSSFFFSFLLFSLLLSSSYGSSFFFCRNPGSCWGMRRSFFFLFFLFFFFLSFSFFFLFLFFSFLLFFSFPFLARLFSPLSSLGRGVLGCCKFFLLFFLFSLSCSIRATRREFFSNSKRLYNNIQHGFSFPQHSSLFCDHVHSLHLCIELSVDPFSPPTVGTIKAGS